ncbi:putative bifunctional diguanylate cyclase/phosphodiesterase [Dactylosporangium sp. CA-092794]|uniref:putative bifunctional diguanylate cyclase/phosphodiesterase n=1 Tax=Dactylosporangium sp. CA-092794 TaxID=3239929 RepID=UPI003D902764
MKRARGWSRPDARVATLSLWLGLATVAAHTLRIRNAGLPAHPDPVPLAILLVAFALTEGFAVHVRVRRGGHAMSLSEIPMVLGLLAVDPTLLLCVRLIGGAVGLAWLRGQRGVKLGFNVALLGVQTTASTMLLRALSGPQHPSSPLECGPLEWLYVLIVMLISDVIAAVLVTAVIALHDDPGEWHRLPGALRGLPLVAVTTSIGLISALAIDRDQRAIALLAIVSAVTYHAYRAYVRQSQGHQQVEELYAFTRALDGPLDTGGVARIVLEQARDQLRAERAELIVPGPGGTCHRLSMHGRHRLDIGTEPAPPEHEWWRPARSGTPVLLAKGHRIGAPVEDGIAVPVPLSDGVTGVLLVADSLPDIPTFGEQHVRLFQALANHASVSLAKARLLDELRREVAQKEHLALYDPLTELPNRQRFQALTDELRAAGTPLAVLLIDLDRFKDVNDALGHDVGDQLLRQVGERLQERLGGRGTVARFGGDEFAVLLPDIRTREVAVAIGDDLSAAMEQPIPIGHLRLNARASIGVALAPEHGDDAKTLIQRADVAMYVAKDTRTGMRVYTADDDRNSPRRLAMAADLREAIQRRDLMVVFQPKLETATGVVVGAEALARWHHPLHGFVPPDEFIPLAEHSGLIRPLTLHVLEVSLRRCAGWRRMGHDMHVAVNLSPSSLQESDLPDIVARLLGQAGVPASALTLEITESSIMADPTGATVILDRLHALGVKLAIDDFGTGYSSLGRLRELPIHEMKIDRSFVQRIAVDHRDRAVVRSAVQLGHALDLMVVAEGVEDEQTLLHLRREGCNLVQGYHISKPLPADDFAEWLTARIPQLGGA